MLYDVIKSSSEEKSVEGPCKHDVHVRLAALEARQLPTRT